MRRFLLALALTALCQSSASAAISLLDSDWKVQMYGFIEQDVFKDSTRGYTELIGNSAGPKPTLASYTANNGRLQYSNRNSRLGFVLTAPEQNGWKATGRYEFDFLGYTPSIYSGPNTTPSEQVFYTADVFRIRQMLLSAEKEGLTLMAGQTWSLFGWQPFFVPPTVSVPPAPGVIFQRTGTFAGMKNFAAGESGTVTAAVALERPSQEDSSMPNVVVGAKYVNTSRKSGYNSTYNDQKAEPMTIAASGLFKQFEHANSATSGFGQSQVNSAAYALDLMIPLIASTDGKAANTLSFFGEMGGGTGYGDALPGFAGTQALTGTAAATANLDAGLAGNINNNNFSLIRLQTWNANLQYHFSEDSHSWVTLGFTHMHSNNTTDPRYTNAATTPYFMDNYQYINYYHDCTKQIRVAAEYAKVQSTFADGVLQNNDRYQFSAWFRF